MKMLRNGFIAIIAILAVGLTLAAQAGVFEGKKVVAVTDCFIPSGTSLQVAQILPCADEPATIITTDACTKAAANYAVWSANPSAFLTDAQRIQQCTGGARFCCFKVKVGAICDNPLLDLGDGTPRQYQVDQVFCRPN